MRTAFFVSLARLFRHPTVNVLSCMECGASTHALDTALVTTIVVVAVIIALVLALLTVYVYRYNRKRLSDGGRSLSLLKQFAIILGVVSLATIGGAGAAALVALLIPGAINIKTQIDSFTVDATGPVATFIVSLGLFSSALTRIALKYVSKASKKDDREEPVFVFVPPPDQDRIRG